MSTRSALALALTLAGALTACHNANGQAPASQPIAGSHQGTAQEPDTAPEGMAIATFAGGCFWCMEAPFDKIDGVTATISGYTDGTVPHPTYKQVGSGTTGHTEGIRIVYDPTKVSYEALLEHFWHNIDPTQKNGQFCDRGPMYRTGIYTHDAEQARLAEASRKQLEASGRLPGPIVTEIKPATPFYRAEEYHQDFYQKEPQHYHRYRLGCGRDARLVELWGDQAGGRKGH
ncbi:MAG: peptide-methionine (S)-S-oxide reductase MsrA [Myxococcales bacterium]|nr:peptide-methionine (S)-S-oxide reductase MsrA [Myxococcales bacterium]MCB9551441.1 peptide-methionine (S)-S-oxide reductase MsrA [Myxococcales bacterium]